MDQIVFKIEFHYKIPLVLVKHNLEEHLMDLQILTVL